MQAAQPDAAERRSPLWVYLLIVASFFAVTLRLVLFIREHAVNVVFWDQWDFLTPHFEQAPLWARFIQQQGPPRQGVGALLITAWQGATDWDGRADAYGALVLMMMAAAGSLLLLRQLGVRLTATDAGIPFLFGTIHSFETYVGTPNAAHGPTPALLSVLVALAFTLKEPRVRTAAVLITNFGLVFTGFGVFAGLITPVLFAGLVWRHWTDPKERRSAIAGAALSPLALVAFRIGYVFEPSIACFKFPDPHPENYLTFIALAVARPMGAVGTRGMRMAVAYSVLLLIVASCSWAAMRIVKAKDERALPVLFFGGFALLFATSSAIGRVCGGVDNASATRYVPYSLFGALGVYVWLRLRSWEDLRASIALTAAIALFWVGKERLAGDVNAAEIRWYSEGKKRWVACYLKREDVPACDEEAAFKLYPEPTPAFLAKLALLKERRLSLFNGR